MVEYNEGYLLQTTVAQATTPLTDLKEIGLPIGGKPIITIGMTEDVIENEIMGQYYPDLEAGNKYIDLVSMHFYATHMRWAFWMLGKRDLKHGDRTIENMDGLTGGINNTGRKPRLTLWKEVGADKRHVYGVLFNVCDVSWGLNALEILMSGKGQVNAVDAFTPTITFEDDIKSLYTHCSVCTWGGGANMKLVGFKCHLEQAVEPVPGDTAFQDINEFAFIKGQFSLILMAANGESMITDKESSTARELIITFTKGVDSTKSKTFTSTCRISQITRQEVIGIPPIYTLLLKAGKVVINGEDGTTVDD